MVVADPAAALYVGQSRDIVIRDRAYYNAQHRYRLDYAVVETIRAHNTGGTPCSCFEQPLKATRLYSPKPPGYQQQSPNFANLLYCVACSPGTGVVMAARTRMTGTRFGGTTSTGWGCSV